MNDNRLDFISNIDSEYVSRMTEIRKKFIALDKEIGMMADEPTASAASHRTVALARTHIETSLQFAIKSLCLLGEIKE